MTIIRSVVPAVLSLSLLLAGCSVTSTTLSGSWRDPGYGGGRTGQVLVVGVAEDELARRMVETEFVQQLQERGVRAVASYTLPSLEQLGTWVDPNYPLFSLDELGGEEEAIRDAAFAQGLDMILISRLVAERVEEVRMPEFIMRGFVAETTAYLPTTYYKVFAVVESSLRNAASGKPVWAAVLETELGDRMDVNIRSFVGEVMKDLEGGGLI